MANSLKEAFYTIDTIRYGVPYGAIQYLYSHPNCDEITEKIFFSLENAYNPNVYYLPKERHFLAAPLWYGFVAEVHLCEELMDALRRPYNIEDSWVFMDEQLQYLTSLLCDTYPETAVPFFLDMILELAKKGSKGSYHYAYETLYYTDMKQYGDLVLEILKTPNIQILDHLAELLAEIGFMPALPIIKDLCKKINNGEDGVEGHVAQGFLEYVIDVMEGKSTIDYIPETQVKRRKPWALHIANFEDLFLKDKERSFEESFLFPVPGRPDMLGIPRRRSDN